LLPHDTLAKRQARRVLAALESNRRNRAANVGKVSEANRPEAGKSMTPKPFSM